MSNASWLFRAKKERVDDVMRRRQERNVLHDSMDTLSKIEWALFHFDDLHGVNLEQLSSFFIHILPIHIFFLMTIVWSCVRTRKIFFESFLAVC